MKESIKNNLLKFFNLVNLTEDFPLNSSLIDDVVCQISKIKNKYISDLESRFLISDIIKDEINEKRLDLSSNENIEGKLVDVLDKNEINNLADKIINYFDSIPRKYTCVFKLPYIISGQQFNVEINNDIRLEFKESRNFGVKLNFLMENVNQYTLSIIIKHSGYLSSLNYSTPYGIFKQLIGIAMAFDYFKFNIFRAAVFSRGLFGGTNNKNDSYEKMSYFIDDEFGDQSKVYMYFSDSVSEKLQELEFNGTENHEKNIDHIKEIYSSFSNDANHANRSCSALEWRYDAKFTNNKIFSFILNCIAIEALMGEKNGGTIEKTLGNRCAYLLAKTIKDRTLIINKMKELYQLRSDLVHGDKSRLSNEDEDILLFAENLIKLIIQNELRILWNSSS